AIGVDRHGGHEVVLDGASCALCSAQKSAQEIVAASGIAPWSRTGGQAPVLRDVTAVRTATGVFRARAPPSFTWKRCDGGVITAAIPGSESPMSAARPRPRGHTRSARFRLARATTRFKIFFSGDIMTFGKTAPRALASLFLGASLLASLLFTACKV